MTMSQIPDVHREVGAVFAVFRALMHAGPALR
jgi:hypothetical protein